MAMRENPFRATLNTTGRKTSKTHSVMLRAVRYNGKIYFSRHMPDSDWFKNALADPEVTVQYGGSTYHGKASLVQDVELGRKISQLKYPGEDRANEKRVAVEVTLYEQ